MNIGHNIKKIRELKGYGQKYVAGQLGIHQATYSKLETGPEKMTMDTLQKIAEVYDMKPLDIMAFDEKTVLKIGTQNNNDNSNGCVINHFPAKIQELYEARIKGLEEEVRFLRNQIKK